MRCGLLLALSLVLLGGCRSRGIRVEFHHVTIDRASLEGEVGPVDTFGVAYLAAGSRAELQDRAVASTSYWIQPQLSAPASRPATLGPYGRSRWPYLWDTEFEAEVVGVWRRGVRTEADVACFPYAGLDERRPKAWVRVSLAEGENAVIPLAIAHTEVMAVVVRADP